MTQVALIIALVAVSSEASSRLIAWRFLRRRYWPFNLPIRALPALLGYGAVVAMSIGELAIHTDVSTARMAGGSALFAVGWVARYPIWILLMGWLRRSPHAFTIVERLAPIRHPRYVGLVLEAAGVAAILSSVGGALLVAVALPLCLWGAVELVERNLMAVRPRMGVDFDRGHRSAMWVPVATGTLLAIGPAAAYLVAAFVTREVSIFESNVEVARNLLLGLAGAQGTLAILGLTAWFVTVELVASSYSAQVVPRPWSRQTAAAAALLVASVGYDIVVVGRSDPLLTGHPTRAGALVDLGLLFAGIAIGAAAWTALSGVRMALPEQAMTNLMKRVDDRWLRRIKDEFRGPPRTLYVGDPLRGAESVLRALADRRDVGSSAIAVQLLADRFRHEFQDEDLIALDVYLHHHLSPLISYVGEKRDSHLMGELMNLAELVERPSAEVVMKHERLYSVFDPPPGELLLREVTDVATSASCDDAARRGLHMLAKRAKALMTRLPPQTEMTTYNPDYDYSKERTEEEKKRQWDNDAKVQLIEEQYVDYFASTATRAVEIRSQGAVWAALDSLIGVIQEAIKIRESPHIRRVLIRWPLFRLEGVVRTMCKVGWADGLYLGTLSYAPEPLKDDDPNAAEIMNEICLAVGRILEGLAKSGLLEWGPIQHAAMLGLKAGESGSGAFFVVRAMGNAVQHLEAFKDREDVQSLTKELKSRVTQVGLASGSHEARQLAEELQDGWAPEST